MDPAIVRKTRAADAGTVGASAAAAASASAAGASVKPARTTALETRKSVKVTVPTLGTSEIHARATAARVAIAAMENKEIPRDRPNTLTLLPRDASTRPICQVVQRS
jgi:hypothetical protein